MSNRDYTKILTAIETIREVKGIYLIMQFLDADKKKIVQDGVDMLEKHGLKFLCVDKDVKKKNRSNRDEQNRTEKTKTD